MTTLETIAPVNGVTIIVCCYNSAKRLPQTLKHLSQQEQIQGIPFEVIIVNNASTDDTKDVAEREWHNNGAPFTMKIIDEFQAGLSFARERGIQEARFEYIVFCDDDNWLSEKYVKTAYEIISTDNSIGLLAGRNIAVSDVELPVWFTTYQVYFAVGVLGLYSGDVSHRGEIWGAGLVFRKSEYLALRKAGFTSMLTDRKGDVLTSGGDTEICKWYLIVGKKLYYDERLYLWHFMESKRLRPEYVEELKSMYSIPQLIIQRYDSILEFTLAHKSTTSKIINIIKHLFKLVILSKGSIYYVKSSTYLEMANFLSFSIFDKDTLRIKKSIKCHKELNP